MIDEITLKNVALISEASLVPATGLTVITGESGSGKSALLSGIKLLVGERGSADMVREGASQLEVEGRFFPRDPALDEDGEGVIVSRSISADGRSRVRMNGSISTVGELTATVGAGVDLCGQHEHQRLLRASNQARSLDRWIGADLEGPLVAYRKALSRAKAARRRLDELESLGKADAARVEDARFTLRRIDEVDPKEGEYEELLAEARRMQNLEDLVRATGSAFEALSGEGGALDSVNSAIAALDAGAAYDARLKNAADALRDASYILDDASREVDALMPDEEGFDAARLETVQERLSSFQGLMRTFGPTMEDVLKKRQEAAGIIETFENSDELVAKARIALDRAESDLATAARDVSSMRSSKAPAFEEAVNALLVELEMPGCAIVCNVSRLERSRWGAEGPDQVEFLFRPAPEVEPRPLNRIASGGEASRVTLAVKAVLGESDEVETLVFDEVDAGVGGKAALAVGGVLRRLAKTHQVIVVTHLAQIAVLGDAHFVVERSADETTETRLLEVSGDARTHEIARMLSGSADPTSLAHAREMLSSAI